MPLKITTKKQLATQAEAEEVAVTVQTLVDQYSDIYEKKSKIAAQIKKLQDQLKPVNAKEAELVGQIEAHYAAKGDDEEFVAEGSNGYIEFGKKGSERKITDMKHVRKVMGDKVFFELAKMNLGDVDKYLTQAERDKCIETSRTARSRTYKKK